MSSSTCRKLRSAIICERTLDDTREESSARTRPLSYDEIMLKRKSKKEVEGSGEEAPEAETTRHEETIRNPEGQSLDTNGAAMKSSRDSQQEASPKKKVEKSSRTEHTHSKSDLRDSKRVVSPKKNVEKSSKMEHTHSKSDSRAFVREASPRKNMERSSKMEHTHRKNDSRPSQWEARRNVERSSRIEQTHSKNDSRDSQREASPRKNMERIARIEHTHSKNDLRDSQREASPRKNVERSSRIEQTHSKNDSRDSQREASPRKNVERIARIEHTHSKNDLRDSQREASPRKNVERIARIEHSYTKNDLLDSQREASPRKNMEKRARTEHIHSKNESRDSQLETSPRKNVERSARIEHTHSKNDTRDRQREASPRKNVERSSRMEQTHSKIDSRDSEREGSPRKNAEKSARTEHTHSKSLKPERRDVEGKSKYKHEDDVSFATKSKNDRQGHMRGIIEEQSRDDSRYNHENKHRRDSVAHDRYNERNGGALERENKRRDRGGDDERHVMRDPVKKHDSGSRYSEISDRKEKTELSCQDDTRSKRRRSRSQERTRAKARRSSSSSPKARKNVLDHVHDHGELSSISEKDSSRRHSDVDRRKITNDGSNSHHRRHGGSSSGLGGYSPRKRKSEAAVKTPSPIHSPERKSAGWDLPPPGTNKNLNTAVPSGTQLVSQTKHSNMIELAAGFSVASSMGNPISAVLSNSLSAFKQASIDSVQLTQATRPMRRLYIDNIPGSATEKDIMEWFNSFLLSSGSNYIRGTRPCISCMIHKEKGQALVEFLTPEDASAALSFDGRSLSGTILKIRRPKDFVEVLSGSSEKSKARGDLVRGDSIGADLFSEVAFNAISDFVEDSPHKIFVGGIAEGISSEMILEIVCAFGTLKAYHFELNEDLKEPCAFLEYADQSVTLKACAGLNGMKLAGRVLTVTQAVPHTESLESSGIPPFYGIPEHVKPLLEMPTQVIKLSNVLDQKTMDSLSEADLEDIVEDVRLECSRFGSVVSINVVKSGIKHNVVSDAKEVKYDAKPIQLPEETNQHLNISLVEVVVDHNDQDVCNVEPSINFKEIDAMDGVEGDTHELVPATTSSSDVGAAGTNTVEELKEADETLPQNYDDDAQEAAVVGASTIDDMGRADDSEGNHQEASIQESGVSSELNPNGCMGIEYSGDGASSELNSIGSMDIKKSGGGEIQHAEDVSGLDKNSEDDKAVPLPEFDKTSVDAEAIPLPTNSGVSEEDINNENSCDEGNIFEVGCVLVEFRRTEASCSAAHCLHGRSFDDRIVTVEYVSLKAYRERFPK